VVRERRPEMFGAGECLPDVARSSVHGGSSGAPTAAGRHQRCARYV